MALRLLGVFASFGTAVGLGLQTRRVVLSRAGVAAIAWRMASGSPVAAAQPSLQVPAAARLAAAAGPLRRAADLAAPGRPPVAQWPSLGLILSIQHTL